MDAGPLSPAALVRPDPGERILAPATSRAIDRWRPRALFVGFLLCHVVLVGFVLSTLPPPPPAEEEIAVEVVQEAPASPAPAPPDPPPPEQPQQQDKQKPPPQQLDLKPAYDAPRASADDPASVASDADKKLSAPKVAPPQPIAEPRPQEQKPETPQAASQAGPDQTAAKPPEEREAEVAAPADPPHEAPEAERTQAPVKAAPSQGFPSFAQQLANFQPTPDYQIGQAAPPTPVKGGSAQTNYLSILYGLIMPHFKAPPGAKASKAQGSIIIYIDSIGHILHQAVLQPSGSQALDDAAFDAVRRAAPFPKPPAGLPPVRFTYTAK